MIRIGLAIPTFNRKDNLKTLIDSIKENTPNIPYDLCCAVDGSTDGTVEMLMEEGVEFIYGSNVGPQLNKNRLFRRFSDYNFLFMIEDDMRITQKGWVELYILASNLFNIPYFTYSSRDDQDYQESRVECMGRTKIAWIKKHNSRFTFFTRRVMEKVGGIDSRFKSYGMGSYEQFERMVSVGQIHKNYGIPVVIDSKYYIKPQENKICLISEEAKIKILHEDLDIYNKIKYEKSNIKNSYRKL